MSLFRSALLAATTVAIAFTAPAAIAPAFAQAPAEVQCARVSPGEAGREEYIVFFGIGSSALDQAAQQVVQRAAGRATATFRTEICLIGRTSPTGSAEANRRLAAQRIQTVQNALTRQGVQRATLGSFSPAAGFGARRDRAENQADRSVTIIFVR